MSLFSLFGEGFESALLTCSLILLVPGAAVGFSARKAAGPALASFAVGALTLSWLRFSGRAGGYSNLMVAAALILTVAILMAPFVNRSVIERTELTVLPAGFLAGAAAAELWRPCVGLHFAQILNDLPNRGLSGLGWMAVYLVGVLSPLVALGALRHLLPDRARKLVESPLAILGAVVLALLALATALGYHEDLVIKLFEWSLDDV